MQPVPFNPDSDLPPIPFDNDVCRLAEQLKRTGLPWVPHVGCFVWDPEHVITPASPFPNHIYFILSLPRFVEIFGSLTAIQEKLVWLPTWHQARLLCLRHGLDPQAIQKTSNPAEELQSLYRLLREALTKP